MLLFCALFPGFWGRGIWGKLHRAGSALGNWKRNAYSLFLIINNTLLSVFKQNFQN
jgi:hypothetical protein